MTQAMPRLRKLVFVFAVEPGKIDYDFRHTDVESTLECGYMEDAVESACVGAVKSNANALEETSLSGFALLHEP